MNQPHPDWNRQVKIGRGRADTGAFHRAMDIARQLLAAGRWPNPERTCLVIHDAYELHRRLQYSGHSRYDPVGQINVYPAVHDLQEGHDFEIVPLTADARRSLGLPLFPLGQIVATRGALALGLDFAPYLARHAAGDWGELEAADWHENEQSLRQDWRLFSAYATPDGRRIWIITEADRSATTILLPDEY